MLPGLVDTPFATTVPREVIENFLVNIPRGERASEFIWLLYRTRAFFLSAWLYRFLKIRSFQFITSKSKIILYNSMCFSYNCNDVRSSVLLLLILKDMFIESKLKSLLSQRTIKFSLGRHLSKRTSVFFHWLYHYQRYDHSVLLMTSFVQMTNIKTVQLITQHF